MPLFPKEFVFYVVCYSSRVGRGRDYTSFITALRVDENKPRVEGGLIKIEDLTGRICSAEGRRNGITSRLRRLHNCGHVDVICMRAACL